MGLWFFKVIAFGEIVVGFLSLFYKKVSLQGWRIGIYIEHFSFGYSPGFIHSLGPMALIPRP